MKKLSVYIIAKDEAARIRRTLEAVRPVADELIVVDSGSTDSTVEIAKGIADKVVFHEWVSFADQKHCAEQLCTHDWVMMDDADEVVSPQLREEIAAWKERDDQPPFLYRFHIASVYPGETKPPRFGHAYDEIRLYHRRHGGMRAEDLTNDRVHPNDGETIGRFKASVWHYSYVSLEQVVTKLNRYTTEELEKNRRRNRHFPILRLFTEMPLSFIRYYFLRRLFAHGLTGFILAVNASYFRWLRIAKDYEMWNLRNELEWKR